MALDIPMPDLPGNSFLKGIDTGSTMFSRLIQPVIERERLKQQQDQFVQNLALQKETEGRAQALLPYMIQQYQDTHRTAANEAQMKELYQNLLRGALSDATNNGGTASTVGTGAGQPGMMPQPTGGQPTAPQMGSGDIINNPPPAAQGQIPGSPVPPLPQSVAPTTQMGQEQELRPGNPRLLKLDSVAGLVPGIPKPISHYSNGMLYTQYPSGRMTAQAINLPGAKTPGEKNVSAKEASKIRDQATALINSANLVQQGYDLLDQNPDLTGPGNVISAIPIPFSGGAKLNLSSNPNVGNFTSVTGKLQAELGKYASQRGGIQAVKWAQSVKPSSFNSPDYNYGMFQGIQRNIIDDYNTLNEQYKAATGEDLPVKMPAMTTTKGIKKKSGGNGKVIKWKMQNGQLVKE
jgi:hypothetical protein